MYVVSTPSSEDFNGDLQLPTEDLKSVQLQASAEGFATIGDYLLSLHYSRIEAVTVGVSTPTNQRNHAQADVSAPEPRLYFQTKRGAIYQGDSAILMRSVLEPESVDLIMTSPPFGLVRKKGYGNEDADRYVEWFSRFVDGFLRVLKPNGSLVIDLGGAWKQGQPTRSLYHYEVLIMLARDYGFHLAQEFYWWNPAKLPTPAEWVNVRRVRVKDAINCIWWLSKTPYPRASNRRVLQPYSESMKDLLKNGYKPKRRPSGHDISDKFQQDNGGAIPPNLLALANTESNGSYQRYCRERGLPEHPARFPLGIPAFFVRMLTNAGDIVLDPFAGSCVTGEVAERMDRKWVCCELDEHYAEGAVGRFQDPATSFLPLDLPTRRTQAYQIYPPYLSAIPEDDSPLIEDGGLCRPAHMTNKKESNSDTQ